MKELEHFLHFELVMNWAGRGAIRKFAYLNKIVQNNSINSTAAMPECMITQSQRKERKKSVKKDYR